MKGFSERNLKLMTQFCREYPHLLPIGQQAVVQLTSGQYSRNVQTKPSHDKDFTVTQHAVAQLPWGHNVLLMQRVKSPTIRLWYMRETLQHGWSRNVLELMYKHIIITHVQTWPIGQQPVAQLAQRHALTLFRRIST